MIQIINTISKLSKTSYSFKVKHNESRSTINDLTIGWQKLNPLSHPNATLAPQARKASVSGKNLNYVTLAQQARPSGEN